MTVIGTGFREAVTGLTRQIEVETRQHAEAKDRELREAYAVLAEVAYRAGIGGLLEDLRRNDPNALNGWKAADWRRFYTEHLRVTSTASTTVEAVDVGWGNATVEAIEEALDIPGVVRIGESELTELRQQVARIRDLEREVDRLRQTAQANSAPSMGLKIPQVDAAAGTPTGSEPARSDPPSTTPAPIQPGISLVGHQMAARPTMATAVVSATKTDAQSQPPERAFTLAEIQAELNALAIPIKPLRFNKQITNVPKQWARHVRALHVLARHGLNPRLLIDALVSEVDGVKRTSGAFKDTLAELVGAGFVVEESVRLAEPVTTLVLWRLSDLGRDLCLSLKWPRPVESGWERLRRLRSDAGSDQIVATLFIAMQALQRGYRVTVLPRVNGPLLPDLRLEMDGADRFNVIVHLGGEFDREGWCSVARQQDNRIVFIARNPAELRRLSVDSHLNGLSGRAGDLDTLVNALRSGGDRDDKSPLFYDEWHA